MATKEKEVVAEPTIKDLLLGFLAELSASVESGEVASQSDLKREFLK